MPLTVEVKSDVSKDMKASSAGVWFVYILCCADSTFYTGISTDIARRCKQHNAGKASRYTRSRRPVRLVYQETYPDQSSSLRREAEIKALSRRQKMVLIHKDRRQAS